MINMENLIEWICSLVTGLQFVFDTCVIVFFAATISWLVFCTIVMLKDYIGLVKFNSKYSKYNKK